MERVATIGATVSTKCHALIISVEILKSAIIAKMTPCVHAMQSAITMNASKEGVVVAISNAEDITTKTSALEPCARCYKRAKNASITSVRALSSATHLAFAAFHAKKLQIAHQIVRKRASIGFAFLQVKVRYAPITRNAVLAVYVSTTLAPMGSVA